MYICTFCTHSTKILEVHLKHSKFHRNSSSNFPCGYNGCKYVFRKYNSLTSHLMRHHCERKKIETSLPSSISLTTFKCSVPLCQKTLDTYKSLVSHLSNHIREGLPVECPYEMCSSVYIKQTSFSSHLSRNHSVKLQPNSLVPMIVDNTSDVMDDEGQNVASDNAENSVEHKEEESNTNDDLYLRNLGLLYLKLQTKFLLPATVIQYIVEEMQNIHSMSQDALKYKIFSKLSSTFNLAQDQTSDMLNEVFLSDLYVQVHSGKGVLRTDYTRKQFFKTAFNYVAPVEYRILDKNDNKEKVFHYVPIIETVKAFFCDKSVQEQYDNPCPPKGETEFEDFVDGSVYKRNALFQNEPDSLQIVLYQDGFQVVQPLGAAANSSYKMLAVYMTIGNLHRHCRSQIDSIQLVAICREKDATSLGFDQIFEPIVKDLKLIETSGIEIHNGKIVKGTVVYVAGDNLGSHQLGGFESNFSTSTYFCRYCTINRADLQSFKACQNMIAKRSPGAYNQIIGDLEPGSSSQGIKTDSVLNQLNFYHVCAPGLPPCLGHDLFEGVVSVDVALFLKYFISKRKWFRLEWLDQVITTFPYSESDKRDKPGRIPRKLNKLGGQACQNWTLLRLLPMMIEEKIVDKSDEVWELLLKLQEIVDIVCAPKIKLLEVFYLQDVIEEYLQLRLDNFPEVKIRPKHHYLAHYPELIMCFGPMLQVWTMRFESKHSYFKRIIRTSRNYVNVTQTLAERHQLLQAYLGQSVRFPNCVQLHKDTVFHLDLYSDGIKLAVQESNLQTTDLVQCPKLTVRHITYSVGSFLVINTDESCNIQFGKIMLNLYNGQDVFFLVNIIESTYHPENRLHEIISYSANYRCINAKSIADFYPLQEYRSKFLKLKHSITGAILQ